MAKKKRKKKTNYNFYLAIFAVIVVLILLLLAYYLSLGGIQTYLQETQPTTTEPELTGGYCDNNRQCFIIGCKSKGLFNCLNTSEMNDFLLHYSENCESYSDVQIKQQNLSFCACIDNMCVKPK